MSKDNGNGKKLILKVELDDSGFSIEFGKVNMVLVSHGIRMAGLQLDNAIIGKAVEKEIETKSPIISNPNAKIPDNILQSLR